MSVCQAEEETSQGYQEPTEKPEKEGKLKKNNLFPGQLLSADHYQSAVPGRTYSSRGSYHPEDMFNGGTVFVDHASGKIF
eukprot:14518195-Ditylum_brightwellii.AAC.1